MLGGEESFGLGGYYRTPIEEALPVTMEVKQKVEIPSLAVVLVDRPLGLHGDERRTTTRSPSSTSPRRPPTSSSICSTSATRWASCAGTPSSSGTSPIRPAKDKQADPSRDLDDQGGRRHGRLPGVLKESYQVLFDRAALLKHVIFLSDGQMTRGDFAGLIRRMAKDKITVSDVAIGKDADVPADDRRRQVGARALLLHRGRRSTDPADLHAGDAAGLQGVARSSSPSRRS